MPRMTTYILVRHGSNSANQPMCPRAVIGMTDADSQGAAKQDTHGYTLYQNQWIQAISWSRASRADREEAEQAEPLRQAWVNELQERLVP